MLNTKGAVKLVSEEGSSPTSGTSFPSRNAKDDQLEQHTIGYSSYRYTVDSEYRNDGMVYRTLYQLISHTYNNEGRVG